MANNIWVIPKYDMVQNRLLLSMGGRTNYGEAYCFRYELGSEDAVHTQLDRMVAREDIGLTSSDARPFHDLLDKMNHVYLTK